ncbi:unnamed protein product [Leptosia nina]|uniref:Peptidase S1 domain-containing protein n=1 Tax=Leptosia nina TaxID=320188 RepID=A0AAV1J4I8_9NEOP
MHAGWTTSTIRNDIAMIRLPQAVQFSNTISPAALPSGSEIFESFAGESAVASGFGFLGDGSDAVISPNQFLSAVTLPVMTNENCRLFFPNHVVDGNICTSGAGSKNVCRGDSGGPLVVNRNNKRILVGITSFGARGCTWGFPAAFARVTYFLDFINNNM